MLRHLGSALAITLLLLALPHCSSGGSSEGSVCSSTFDSLVAYYDRCQANTATAQLGSQKSRYELLCAKQLAAPGAGAGYSARLQSCAGSLSTQACDTEIECDDDFKGTLADGTACADDFQCASGSCSKDRGTTGTSESSCGKCAPKIPTGGACKGSSSECADKGTCVFTSSAGGTCQAKTTAKTGEECMGGATPVECEKGSSCYFPAGPISSTTRATCRPQAGAGGDCTSRNDCTSGLACTKSKCSQPPGAGQDCEAPQSASCAKGLICGTDKKCQTIAFVNGGESCDQVTRRCLRGRCKGLALGTAGAKGTCEDPLPDGAACTTVRPTGGESPQPCDTFAKCINSVCTLFDPATCK